MYKYIATGNFVSAVEKCQIWKHETEIWSMYETRPENSRIEFWLAGTDRLDSFWLLLGGAAQTPSCAGTRTWCYAMRSSFALAHKLVHLRDRVGWGECDGLGHCRSCTHGTRTWCGSLLSFAHVHDAPLWDLLLYVNTNPLTLDGAAPLLSYLSIPSKNWLQNFLRWDLFLRARAYKLD